MSQTVLAAKLEDIASTGASIVATANPGCTIQLETGLRRAGREVAAQHVIELLDRSYGAGDRDGSSG